jgi:hypothetical protein
VGPPCVPLALLPLETFLDPRPLQVTQGDPEALCQSGLDHYAAGRPAKAAELFSQAVAQGHAQALCSLGVMCVNGEGVPQNSKKAAGLFSKAVAQGHAGAQHNLGCMYRAGDWVPQDRARGLALLQQAAAQGHEPAQEDLAEIAANEGAQSMAEALIREEEEAEACPLPATHSLTLSILQAVRASKGKTNKAKKKNKLMLQQTHLEATKMPQNTWRLIGQRPRQVRC